MRDLLPNLLEWRKAGKPAALATVIKTWGSSPRPTGSHMAVSSDGHFCGSVSGGCVESALIAESLEVIKTNEAKRLAYGVSNETALEVGLACGGQIEIFLQPLNWEEITPLLESIQNNQPAWYSIRLDPPGSISLIPTPKKSDSTPSITRTAEGEVFTNTIPPALQLVIVGGVNLAQPLVKLAKTLDFHTIIIDPRSAFASRERFPEADQIINAWPQDAFAQMEMNESTAVAILSHDDKIDLPALKLALGSPAFYVGALGSRATQQRRKQLLREESIDPQVLERIKGPIGLDLGGTSPGEIALAIMAEITAEFHRK